MNIIGKFIGSRLFRGFEKEIDYNNLPNHIAIIMDGNGRWAKRKGIPRSVGHREGAKTLRNIVLNCEKIGIKYLTVYAFSTENWKRPKEEIETLMNLLKEFLAEADKKLNESNIKIKVIGDIGGLPTDVQNEAIRVENVTKNNTGLIFNVALNYGARAEIVNAVRRIIKQVNRGQINETNINEDVIGEYLYTSGIPDPDLLIRTSAEYRLSNFLLWQLAYTELWFDNVLWPDFSEKYLMKAIYEYQKRHRRFGGI